MARITTTQRLLPRAPAAAPRPVVFVALPGTQLLDIVGPMEAFDVANRLLLTRGRPAAYSLSIAAPAARIGSASGAQVYTTPLARVKPPHTLVVGGSLELVDQKVPAPVLQHLGRLAEPAQRVVSICAGAFVLGDLGLLDGRRCTTHWLALDALRRRFPKAKVETDAIYTHDGRICTSAGVTTGIDLALYLIERDLGSTCALAVARLLVVFFHRPGGQSQFSATLHLRSGVDQRIRRLVASIVEQPAADHAVDGLAHRVAMSTRHFSRIFRDETGMTPAAFVERVRVDAARSELELTDHNVSRIAHDCGFGTDETMRRVFQRALGVSPADYRARFHRRPSPPSASA